MYAIATNAPCSLSRKRLKLGFLVSKFNIADSSFDKEEVCLPKLRNLEFPFGLPPRYLRGANPA